jgi:hypothetical protein
VQWNELPAASGLVLIDKARLIVLRISMMDKRQFDRADYSVVVKTRAPPPKAWRWEIYRAGNARPIAQSSVTVVAAREAGKEALNKLLEKIA